MKKIEIPLSKSKITFLIIGAIIFVSFGVAFFMNPEKFISPVMRNPEFIKIVGVAAIAFFGAAAILGVKKLFDTQIGLSLDENGIFDNTNASSIGLIKWGDIKKIETKEVASNRFLLIHIANPEEYLNKAKGLKRKLLQANNKMYGTPLSITFSALNYNFSELEKIITETFTKYQKQTPNR